MFSLLPRFLFSIFSSSPSQPPRPGSFSAQQLEQIEVMHYREEESAPAPAQEFMAIALAPEPVQEQQPLTEGKGGDVAIPMSMVAEEAGETVEQIEVAVKIEETRDAGVLPSAPQQQPVPVALKRIPSQEELSREIERAVQIVRPELNIEKHADFIFVPSHSKNLNKERTRQWLATLEDGTQAEASLTVQPYNGKTPTTKTRKAYLALHKLWEDNGWDESERTKISLYQLTQAMGKKWQGGRASKELEAEALQLRFTPMIWRYAFLNEKGERVRLLQTFTILDDYRHLSKEDRDKKELFLSLSSFRFHEEIRKNLKANHTKPTNLDVALSLRGELASVLYAHLDIILANKTSYERTTEGLFADLQLEGEKYQYPGHRKQNLEKAIKELDGKPLSTGVLHLTLEKTKEGKDWKLVAKKTPLKKEHPKAITGKVIKPANPPEAIPHLARDLADTLGGYGQYRQLYEKLYKTYSADLVYDATREWNADGGRDAHRPLAFFLAILHRIAHQRGKLWIKLCPPDCKHLPKN